MTKKSKKLQKIKSKIINLCIKDEKCIQQILQKLRNCGCNEIDSMKIIQELIQQDYINEERYSKSFFSGKFKMYFIISKTLIIKGFLAYFFISNSLIYIFFSI